MEGVAYRVSAAALQSRGLITTSGRGQSWSAAITAAGKEYLRQVDGPDAPLPRQANVSVTQQLVDNLLRAGGSLRVPRKQWGDGEGVVDYERRARLAEAHSKVPPGSRFVITYPSADEVLLELVANAGGDGAGAEAGDDLPGFVVPARVRKHHPVAAEFARRTSLHEVSRAALPRVLRIVHALALEAERRGWSLACVNVREDRYGRSEWKPGRDGQLVFTINGHKLPVRVWEKGAGLRGPYEYQKRRWQEDRDRPVALMQFVYRPKPYDTGATGELNIAALGYSSGRQSSWGDRKRWRLENRLPHLLRELESQAAEAEERRLAKEREAAERQRLWEEAMERAKLRLVEHHRLAVLRERVRVWQEAEAIRAYCDAVEGHHSADAIAADPEAAEWLALARRHANKAQQLPRMPADPEATPEALKPFLDGLSPYGPRGW
jgi:hypothetical protein